MKRTRIVVVVMAIFLVLAAVSCKNEVHEHTFAEKWSSDETNHWHVATCEHSEEKDGFAKHTFGDWIVDAEPEFSKNGSRHRICTVCEYKETESIPMTGHVHEESEEWSKDETGHWKTCKVNEDCSHTFEKENHAFEWKQNEEGDKHYQKCSVCGYSTEEEAHSYGSESPEPKVEIVDGKPFYGLFCETCGAMDSQNFELYVVKEPDDFEKGFNSGNSMFYLANDLEILETGKMEFKNGRTFVYLNDNTLTLHGQLAIGGGKDGDGNSIPSAFGAEKGTVIFDIAGLEADKNAIEVYERGEFGVNNVDIISNIGGVFTVNNENDTAVMIVGGSLTAGGYYAIGTNATKPESVNVRIGLMNTKITAKYSDLNGGDNTGLLFNVSGQVYIEKSTITADRQAVILRTGGNSDNPHGIVDSTLVVTGKNTVTNNHYSDNWSSGNEVPSAALIVGNKTTGKGYALPTYAHVENITIEIGEDADTAYKAVCVAQANDCAVNLEISFADGRSIEGDVYKATEIAGLKLID